MEIQSFGVIRANGALLHQSAFNAEGRALMEEARALQARLEEIAQRLANGQAVLADEPGYDPDKTIRH